MAGRAALSAAASVFLKRLAPADLAELMTAGSSQPAVINTQCDGVAGDAPICANRCLGVKHRLIVGFEPGCINAQLGFVLRFSAEGDRNFGFQDAIDRAGDALVAEPSAGQKVDKRIAERRRSLGRAFWAITPQLRADCAFKIAQGGYVRPG